MQKCRPVGAGGTMAPPYFSRSVNPISTKESDYAHHNTNCYPGFSDPPAALKVAHKGRKGLGLQ